MDDENINLLDEIMNTLQTIYKPTELKSHKNYLLYTPQIGIFILK